MKRVLSIGIAWMLAIVVLGLSCFAAEKSVQAKIWVDIRNGGTALISGEGRCPMPEQPRLVLRDKEKKAFQIEYTEEGLYSYKVSIEPDGRDIVYDPTVYNVQVYVTDEGATMKVDVIIYDEKTGKKYAPETHTQIGGLEMEYDGSPMLSFRNDYDPSNPGDSSGGDSSSSGSDSSGGDNSSSGSDSSGGDSSSSGSDSSGGDSSSSGEDSSGGSSSSSGHEGGGSSSKGGRSSSGGTGSRRTHQPKTGDDSQLTRYLLLSIVASAGLFFVSFLYFLFVDYTEKKNRR